MELFKLFGTIVLHNQDANHGMDETASKAESLQSKIGTAFEKIGTAAAKVGAAVASGLAAGTAAFGAMVKDAVGNYAEYEQLVGGVETLFKDSGAAVLDYASKAYATAGLSANEYMETVTSFSASLLQSLGNDTEAAAVMANQAITDMSDNANKMGTDMSMIQTAYQGFAKQNYSMLDNLKLGYGGTQAEMYRLMRDAAELDETFANNAVFSLDAQGRLDATFSDIVQAINIVQTEMGITGTTAKEASTTIQGSLASAKSAWTNFLTGMADDTQNFDALLGNLVDSIITVGNNLVPRIQLLLPRLVEGVNQLIGTLLPYLPGIVESLLPGLLDGAVALVLGLAQMLPSLVQTLFSELPYLISNALYNSTSPALSTLGSLFLDIGEFWNEVLLPAIFGVGEALGTLWGAVQPILAVFPALFTETTGITSGFDIFREMCFMVESALQTVAGKITEVAAWISDHSTQIQDIIHGLWEDVQYVWNTIGQPIFDLIVSVSGIVRDTFAQYMPEIKEFVSQCFTDIGEFWNNNLKPCLDAIGNFIKNVLAPIFESVFNGWIAPAVETAFTAIKSLWNDVLKPVFTGITDFLTGVFTLNFEQAWNGILSFLKGIMNGIINGIEYMINGAISSLNGLISGINKAISLAGSLLGLDVSIPTISKLNLPRLEEGGILEKGQVGLLEGKGAEAVVPLDQNRAWISAVAKDMETAGIGGNNRQTQRIIDLLEMLVDMLPDTMKDAFASMKMEFNKREVARMVKVVN